MNKKIFKSTYILILILTITLNSGNALETIFEYGKVLKYLTTLPMFIFIGTYLKNRNIKVFETAFLVEILVLCVSFLIFPADWMFILNLVFSVFLAYGTVLLFEFDDFVNVFIKLMIIVTIISIIGYILVNNTHILSALFPTFINRNGVVYKIGFIFNYITIIPERNCAIFWEPGMFACFLIIAMIFEIILKDKTNYIHLFIFSIGIFTANSSAGFVLWILCMVLFILNLADIKQINNPVIFLCMIVVFSIGIIAILNLDKIILSTELSKNEYFIKLLSQNINDSTRNNAIRYNLKTFFESPFVGIGATQYYQSVKYVADTSTSTFFMSVFGFGGLFYTLFYIYGILKINGINIFSKICLLAIIISILNTEPQMNNIFIWCFLFYLLKKDSSNKKSKVKNENTT